MANIWALRTGQIARQKSYDNIEIFSGKTIKSKQNQMICPKKGSPALIRSNLSLGARPVSFSANFPRSFSLFLSLYLSLSLSISLCLSLSQSLSFHSHLLITLQADSSAALRHTFNYSFQHHICTSPCPFLCACHCHTPHRWSVLFIWPANSGSFLALIATCKPSS